MVNAGRVACIFTPFVLSLGALVCLVLVFLAGEFKHNKTLDDFYFLKIDLSNFTSSVSANLPSDDSLTGNTTLLGGALEAAKQSLGLQDYYTIYLRNYCGWNGNDKYSNCTDPSSFFYFDVIKIWGLNDTGTPTSDYLPDSLRAGLDTYKAASKAMFFFYCAALAATSATILVGISAIFSRWGSLFTSFFAGFATLAYIVSSVLATVIFLILKDALNHNFKDDLFITSSIGKSSLTLTWIGTAFAVAAGLFWTLSICCCSGRSPYNKGGREARRTRAEKAAYTYERVGSPYLGPNDSQAIPLNTFANNERPGMFAQQAPTRERESAYEPFRSQQV